MRILLISHTCQSRTEGQPKARCLAQLPDIELKVMVPDRWKHYGKWRTADPAPTDEFDCNISRVAWPWIGAAQYYLHWYPDLKKVMRDFRPDVIDLWEEPWGLVSVQTCFLRSKLLPSTKIVTESEQNINKHLPFPFEWFRSYTLNHADFAVGRSKEAVSILREKGYRGDAEAVPNAVDTSLFRPLKRQTCREKLGLWGFVVGYVGRLVEAKGLADMLDALKVCPPEVNLLFVGTGDYEEELRHRIELEGIGARVTILGGRPLDQLPEVMNALDVLVLTSRTTATWKEQFGRVIIEAQSCGIPVIGSNSGAIPDVVGDGGLIFAEGDSKQLAHCVCTMYADEANRRAMGERGRVSVAEKYTWEKVAARMHDIYIRVASTKGVVKSLDS